MTTTEKRARGNSARGLPNVIPLMVLAAMVLSNDFRAQAFELHGWRSPGSHPRAPFYVSTNLAGNVPYNGSIDGAIEAIGHAAAAWNLQGASNFRFFCAGTTEATNAANDGINAVIFNPNPCPYANTGCTAETFVYRSTDLSVEGFDIVLYGSSSHNDPIRWSDGNFISMIEADIWSVVIHELGHVAGLAHSTMASIMETACNLGCKSRSLVSDYANGLQALYGAYSNEGIWVSRSNFLLAETFALYLDYPLAAGRQYQIVADFDGLSTGWDLRNTWAVDSRIFSLDRCPYPAGSREPALLESLVLPINAGFLDSNGQAQVTVRVPESLSCFPTNRQWFFSVVTYGTNLPSGIEDVGVAVELNVQTPPGPQLFVRSINRAFGLAELRWLARANRPYQLEASTSLIDWAPFGPLVPAPSFDGWLTSVVAIAESPQFFRLQELPPPGLPCEPEGVLAIIVSTNRLRVPEGGTAGFTIQLNGPPHPNLVIEITRTGGDSDLQVSGDSELTFGTGNWSVPQTFTLLARPDADSTNGVATFTIKRIRPGSVTASSVTVTVEEIDDDAPP